MVIRSLCHEKHEGTMVCSVFSHGIFVFFGGRAGSFLFFVASKFACCSKILFQSVQNSENISTLFVLVTKKVCVIATYVSVDDSNARDMCVAVVCR